MKTLILFAGVLVLLTGCSTTKQSRRHDLHTAELLRDYREKQEARVEKVTQEYRKIHSDQMARLNNYAAEDFEGRLALQRGKMADSLIANFGAATAPSAFQITFHTGLQDEYQFLADIERTISQAREAYAKSYSEVQLELKKIKAAEEAMRDLSIKPSTRRELNKFIGLLYNAYREAQKKDEQEKNNPSQT